jgi:hypothetical protein
MNTEFIPENKSETDYYALVPADFPRIKHLGAVPGTQTKLLVVKFEDKYYTPGDTPPERFKRWKYCEESAQHLKLKSIECKAGKRSHMTEEEILDQYLVRLLATRWMSPDDTHWTVKRMAILLDWPVPRSVTEFFSA